MRWRLLSLCATGSMALLLAAGCDDRSPALIALPSPSPTPPPPQTYTVSGTVAQSGGGPPLGGTTVRTTSFDGSPIVATTDVNGSFQLSGVRGGLNSFMFSKPGLEEVYRGYDITSDRTVNVHLHPRLEMSADDTLTATVYSDDPYYSDLLSENTCEPCKQIRVNVPRAGTLDVRLTLPAQSTELGLLIETKRLSAGVGCCRPEISGAYPSRHLRRGELLCNRG